MHMHAFGFPTDGVCVNAVPRQSGGNEEDTKSRKKKKIGKKSEAADVFESAT